jgi:hypothetical protein
VTNWLHYFKPKFASFEYHATVKTAIDLQLFPQISSEERAREMFHDLSGIVTCVIPAVAVGNDNKIWH